MASAEVEHTPRPDSQQTTFSASPSHNRESFVAGNTDSFVTVRLSESDVSSPAAPLDEADTASTESDATVEAAPARLSMQRADSFDVIHGRVPNPPPASEFQTPTTAFDSARNSVRSVKTDDFPAFQEEDVFENASATEPRSRSGSESSSSHDSGAVDWTELERNEEEEARDEVSDKSTAFLLARLEQENNALTADPRFGLKAKPRGQSRPPSIAMLKKLVKEPPSRVSRYSILQDPPPMTELEFWAALVKDYPQTAQRLPTLTTNKIKNGVPPPLRGVVWMSMVGARDSDLADQFEKLCLETSPYEGLIGKDIGRSFPGVDMFRDPDGEGQQMLGRVLRAFSLYDKEIGYCQGLGFLVGPLLMQMGDRDAFCVLVKLMENYDLRSCFLPDLSGLHIRIFQFQRLLDQHMPVLAAHLASLQVEAAYLSQWFLSFFAVTCPLPMLFRIYDVIFAEGASETIMRVALSLMKRNEQKIMESKEFEEVMQLLLSRSLWEAYSFNADELVTDFMEMSGLISRDSLQKLEASFRATHGSDPGAWFAFLPDAQAAASRFLGRLWTASTPMKGAGGLIPSGGHSRGPSFLLRRTPSKQSIATINSTDMSSDSTNSVGTITTDATAMSRDSSGDALSMASKPESLIVPQLPTVTKEDKDLHSQIEDLLTALSDMQRQHAILSASLQKEREERSEDCRTVEDLVSHLRKGDTSQETRAQSFQFPPKPVDPDDRTAEARRQTMQALSSRQNDVVELPEEVQEIVQRVDQRLQMHRAMRQSRASDILETKQRLRDSLIRSRQQAETEMTRSSSLAHQLEEKEQETTQIRENLRQVQARLQDELRKNESMERTIQNLKGGSRSSSRTGSIIWSEADRPSFSRTDTMDSRTSIQRTSSGSTTGGLRELKLGRPSAAAESTTHSTSNHSHNLSAAVSAIPKRGSSLATQTILATQDHAPASEEEMLVELVNAKTAEAVARQELEEVKGKLDSMRRMLGAPSPPPTLQMPINYHKPTASESTVTARSAATTPSRQGSGMSSASDKLSPPQSANNGVAASIAGSFWGWGKRSPSASSPGQAQAASGSDERSKS